MTYGGPPQRGTVAVEIRKRRLIQQLRVHYAARSEVIDNQVEEFELIGG